MPNLIRHLPFLDALLSRRTGRRSGACNPRLRGILDDRHTALLEDRRGEAMRRLFPKLRAWRATTFARSAALNAYCYLAEATSVDELERRIDQLESRRHFRH